MHIQLFYPDLDGDQRYSMWMTFLNKLEEDRPSIQVKYALKEYLRSSEMRGFKMNGREIRNGECPSFPLSLLSLSPGSTQRKQRTIKGKGEHSFLANPMPLPHFLLLFFFCL